MHPEADAFLDAIFDHPDEDTPRLVYADWLQERGQESYAQFIRLQRAVAREKLWSDEANRLWVEIGRVWNRLDREWWPATKDVWKWSRHSEGLLDAIHFDRGFLKSGVRVSSGHLVRAEACWAWLPAPGTELELAPGCGTLGALATLSTLRRITRIRCGSAWEDDTEYLEDPVDPHDLDILLRSPHLCRLRELDLSIHSLTQSNLNTLLTAPNLSTVEYLYVAFHPPEDYDYHPDAVADPAEAIRQLKERFEHVRRCAS